MRVSFGGAGLLARVSANQSTSVVSFINVEYKPIEIKEKKAVVHFWEGSMISLWSSIQIVETNLRYTSCWALIQLAQPGKERAR